MLIEKTLVLLFLCLSTFYLQITSCRPTNSKADNSLSENKLNEIRFKNWLKDTLRELHTNKVAGYNQQIIISKDSLYLEIENSYNVELNKPYKGNKKELIYAVDLLTRNGITQEKKTDLQFAIKNYYTIPMVKQLIYDFDSEITKFNILTQDSIIKYRFLKGNLISRASQGRE